jgi:hypothetical protein
VGIRGIVWLRKSRAEEGSGYPSLTDKNDIGRAVFPGDADSADGLLGHADASMFQVKRGFVNPR